MDTKPTVSNFIAVILPALIVVFVIFVLVMPKVRDNRAVNEPSSNVEISGPIDSFEECEAAGFPVMESYPRQCATADGETFTEDVGPIVGGDKDIHGCIGSAGYTWCGPKVKCLRAWEEECYESAEQEIKYRLAERLGITADDVEVSIKQQAGDHLAGELTVGDGSANAGLFLAYQSDGMIEILFDGNGAPDCDTLRGEYRFPETILKPNYCN